MIRSASCSTLRRLWASLMTIANSSPPMRPTVPSARDLVDQALGDGAKHGVALRVAEGVVDRLEAVEVEKHDRARAHCRVVAPRSASPSSWRTRPRLGRPDSTSTLARWVSRSCVWRISVMSEPTPRKPSKRPAVSMIGSPAIEIQRVPRGVPSSISSALNGCFSSSTLPSSAWPPSKRGKRMAEQLARRPAEHRAHARADVGDAVLAIDRPQPADAALLIFLEQQARAFALAADVGIGLELAEGPAGDGHDAGDRHAEREQDRQHVLERNACGGRSAARRRRRAVKAIIHAIAHCGTTTRPSPPTPRPAMTEAAMTCVPGSSDGKK